MRKTVCEFLASCCNNRNCPAQVLVCPIQGRNCQEVSASDWERAFIAHLTLGAQDIAPVLRDAFRMFYTSIPAKRSWYEVVVTLSCGTESKQCARTYPGLDTINDIVAKLEGDYGKRAVKVSVFEIREVLNAKIRSQVDSCQD